VWVDKRRRTKIDTEEQAVDIAPRVSYLLQVRKRDRRWPWSGVCRSSPDLATVQKLLAEYQSWHPDKTYRIAKITKTIEPISSADEEALALTAE